MGITPLVDFCITEVDHMVGGVVFDPFEWYAAG